MSIADDASKLYRAQQQAAKSSGGQAQKATELYQKAKAVSPAASGMSIEQSQGSIANPIANALGFGWTDEALAGGLSLFSLAKGDIPDYMLGDTYNQIREGIESERKAYAEANPGKAATAEIATLVAGGLPAILEKLATKGVIQAGLVAGLEGLLYGAGESQGGTGIEKGEKVLGVESPVEVPQRLIDGLKTAGISIPTGLAGAQLAKYVSGVLKDKATVNKLVREGSLDARTADKYLKNPDAIEGEFIPSGSAVDETGVVISQSDQALENISQPPQGAIEVLDEVFNPLKPKVKTSKTAQRALYQKVPENLLTSVREASPATRREMDKMLKIRRAAQTNDDYARKFPVYSVIGDSFMKRFDKVAQEQVKASKEIGEAVTKFEGKKVDYPEVAENLQKGLDDLGITLNEKGKLDFSKINKTSTLREPATMKQLQGVVDDLVNIQDASDLHKLKKDIDKRVSYDTSTLGAKDSDAERLLKQVRADINDVLRQASPDYAKANDVYSKNRTALDNLGAALPKTKKFDFDNPKDLRLARDFYGQQLRKLESNYPNKTFIQESVMEFDDLAKGYGGKFEDDIGSLVTFEAGLTNRFGDLSKNAFQTKVESGTKRALTTDPKGWMRGGWDWLTDKSRNITDEEAFEALDAYIKERGFK